VEILFDGEIHVHYHQFYVVSRDAWDGDVAACFEGQINGLCGASLPGLMFLTTGLHTGSIGLSVQLHSEPPVLESIWEDAVEVSFSPQGPNTALSQWAGEAAWDLQLPARDYRVRYCARGMDAARGADTLIKPDPVVDHYLLQCWPSPAAADAIVRQGSATAAYWHSARGGGP
jgi:hypothetical protein